jgi:hypothetical protein
MLVLNSLLAWVYLASVIVLSFLGAWLARALGAYSVKRAELRATKETLETITRIEGKVRQDFNLQLETFRNDQARAIEQFRAEQVLEMERFKAGQTHRFLAGEKRLQAHQEAFTHWRKVFATIHQADFLPTVNAAIAWWNSNCLYLDGPARHLFIEGMNAIYGHQTLFNSNYGGDRNALHVAEEAKQKLMERFDAVAPAIFEAAKVPVLAGDELAVVKDGLGFFERDYAD